MFGREALGVHHVEFFQAKEDEGWKFKRWALGIAFVVWVWGLSGVQFFGFRGASFVLFQVCLRLSDFGVIGCWNRMIGFYVWVLGSFGFRFGSSHFECLDLFRL